MLGNQDHFADIAALGDECAVSPLEQEGSATTGSSDPDSVEASGRWRG
jgi:hypothetical protein